MFPPIFIGDSNIATTSGPLHAGHSFGLLVNDTQIAHIELCSRPIVIVTCRLLFHFLSLSDENFGWIIDFHPGKVGSSIR